MEKKTVLVFNDPLDDFPALKLPSLGNGGGKVDIPLLTVLALDELSFGGKTHKGAS